VFKRESKDLMFVGQSSVLEASRLAVSEGGAESQINKVQFAPIEEFESPRPLREMAGSLQRVYRYLDPNRHFARQVNALQRDDYETIAKASIEIPRSIFRYLFSALPLPIQSEFVRTYPGSFPSTAQGFVHVYAELARELLTFLESRVRVPIQLLASVASAYGTIERAKVPQVREWWLAPGEDTEDKVSPKRQVRIPVGAAAETAASVLEQTSLFEPNTRNVSVLEECRKELATFEGQERRWRDPVF
jgi:hypothetical protein